MNEDLRRQLRAAVAVCRRELETAIAGRLESHFGIHLKSGKVEPAASLRSLTSEEQADRIHLVNHLQHLRAAGLGEIASVERLVREISFTHLNRLVAFKMLERRKRIKEAVGKGTRSRGFLFFLADHPNEEALVNEGKQDLAYHHFLLWQAGQLAAEVGELFSPLDSAACLFPPQRVLDAVLEQINADDVSLAWDEPEALGWVYQYFTPREQREKARKESQAPRGTYEMAFRNQFYTPRYVVDFLSQNTLGRLWDEMRGGDTALRETCRFLVYRAGEVPPARTKKDPRELKILDPACGSGHFLLACYDLLETIYDEAYYDPDLGPKLQQDFPALDDFRAAVPALILERNLYGIDIDRRAVQIAALVLWMRAQQSYHRLGISRQIQRTNIVCAEPMPGESDLLEQFLAGRPEVERDLVRKVFEAMKTAGEAGSLLKIEDVMAGAIADAKHTQLLSWQDPFWQHPEQHLLAALERYAGQGDYGSRLFLRDAVRGFGFIELCRQHYDVVLMNPPFGEACKGKESKSYIDKAYLRTRNDVYAAFVERGLELLEPSGFLGAITSRTGFFLTTFQRWREEILLKEARLTVVADLGQNVLDTAMVETAAYCLQRDAGRAESLWFRLLQEEDKSSGLATAVAHLKNGEVGKGTYRVDTDSFRYVLGSPFTYWVSDAVRRLWSVLPPIGQSRVLVCSTNPLNEDNRYFRLFWEVPAHRIGRTRGFVDLSKGGDFSRFYSDPHLVAAWDEQEQTYRGFLGTVNRPLKRPASLDHFFRKGITWSRRSLVGFSARNLPEGTIFHDKGPGIFAADADLLPLLGILNSSTFAFLLSMHSAFGSYEVGMIQKTPLPDLDSPAAKELVRPVLEAIRLKQGIAASNELSHGFVVPAPLLSRRSCLRAGVEAWQQHIQAADDSLRAQLRTIDETALTLYGLQERELGAMTRRETANLDSDLAEPGREDEEPPSTSVDGQEFAADLVSYAVGCVFGRWDVRFATGEKTPPPLPDPFAPLPACSPGMLIGDDGLPLAAAPPGYPLDIASIGILVDYHEHPDDIVRRVRRVFDLIWKDRADAIEREACELLGVRELRDYFRRPGGFWQNHRQRYSRSRRTAPLYWLLQSERRNYAVWLYYHCLDKDLLYKALHTHVEPRVRRQEQHLEQLRTQHAAASGRAVRQLEREIERGDELLAELQNFRDRLKTAAERNLEPNLDDGVILTIAPLHELVPWPEARTTWQDLEAGEYAWSSIGKQMRDKGLVRPG